MDAATLPSFDVAELHVAAAVLGFRHDLQTVVDTHQSAPAIPRIVRPLPFVRGASVDALGSEALAREVRQRVRLAVRERCERHGVVFHCVHGSPAPAGRKKRSTGPKVAVTSDVNMPASRYSCFRSLMSSVALCAGSSTSAPSCDVSVD